MGLRIVEGHPEDRLPAVRELFAEYADSLEVFVHLRRTGYDASLCRWLARRHLWQLKKRFVKGALTNNPFATVATAARVMKYLTLLQFTR